MGTLVLPEYFVNVMTGEAETDGSISPLEGLAHVLNGAQNFDPIKGYELIKRLREAKDNSVYLDTSDLENLEKAIKESKISQFAKAQLLYSVKEAKKE